MRVRTAIFLAVALAACKDNAAPASTSAAPAVQVVPREPSAKDVISMANIPEGKGDLYAIFQTSRGNIVVKLLEKEAPKTVANFVGLATGKQQWTDPRTRQKSTAKLYDGTVFHRVIDGFMIQGGGFTKEYVQKPTRPPVQNEAEQSSKAGLLNVPGTVAMARTPDPHSASAQFFINVNDNKFLNFRSPDPQGYGYTVFGKVTSGMDVVGKIAKTPTGAGGPFPKDVPQTPVVIQSAKIVSQ